MAWIEQRRELHRVYWYNRPGVQPRRDYEAFASRGDAELFIRLISALAGDPVAARDYVRRNATSAPTAEAVQAGGLRLDTLRDAYLETKTAVYDETRRTYTQLIEDHIISYFGADFDVARMRPVPSLAKAGVRDRTSVSGWLAWMGKRPARTSHGRQLPHVISAKTIRNVHGVLAEMLEMAVDDPDIGMGRNPCGKSKLPRPGTQEMQFLEKWQFAQLLGLFSEFFNTAMFALQPPKAEVVTAAARTEHAAFDPHDTDRWAQASVALLETLPHLRLVDDAHPMRYALEGAPRRR